LAKILIVSSGLKHAQEFVKPFLKRLVVHLKENCDCLDLRNAATFDERTFFEYDQVIFIFFSFLDSFPSSTLEIFERLENQPKNHTEIYALIACDEYEAEKCHLPEKILNRWCIREDLRYKGSLKIGSALVIMETASKFVVSNYIKNFAKAVLKHEKIDLKVTMLTDRIFMKKANQYWYKEIKKKYKEKLKQSRKVF